MNEALEKIFLEEKIEYAEAIPYDLLNHNPNYQNAKIPQHPSEYCHSGVVPYMLY